MPVAAQLKFNAREVTPLCIALDVDILINSNFFLILYFKIPLDSNGDSLVQIFLAVYFQIFIAVYFQVLFSSDAFVFFY